MFKDRLKLLKSYLLRKEMVDTYPQVIGIEVTNKCNLECIMCPRQEMKREIGDMDIGLFKKIIDEIKGRAEFIWLQDYGEPLLHNDIFRMIKYVKSAGLNVGISTNATVLDNVIINNILESKLDYMIFAFDGAIKDTYERIRKGAKYDKVIENIKLFLEEKNKKQARLFTVLQCIHMDETEREIKDFVKIWRIKGVNGIRIRQITYSGTGKYRNLLKKPCYWLWHDPHITWDGTLIPCCQDVNAIYPLGSVVYNSVGELWNSKKMNLLRQLHINGRYRDIVLCRDCNMYQPSNMLMIGSSFFNIFMLNKLVPRVESYLSRMRY